MARIDGRENSSVCVPKCLEKLAKSLEKQHFFPLAAWSGFPPSFIRKCAVALIPQTKVSSTLINLKRTLHYGTNCFVLIHT